MEIYFNIILNTISMSKEKIINKSENEWSYCVYKLGFYYLLYYKITIVVWEYNHICKPHLLNLLLDD